MKLTPWMLTVATFGMVGFIAVSYLAKQSGSPLRFPGVYASGGSVERDPGSYAPPIRIRTATDEEPAGSGAGVVRVDPSETGNTEVNTDTQSTNSQDAGATRPYTPGVEDPPVVVSPENPPSDPPPDRPVDQMFEGPSVKPPIVTEHYRGGQRSTAAFSDGRRVDHN